MKATILAAGLGTRLRLPGFTGPKPMVPIAGQPLLDHTVNLLRAHGVREVAINLHHQPEAIVRHFGDGARSGVRVRYSHEPQLLGTAGALKRLEGFLDRSFYVVYGDVLTDMDLSALAAWHRERRAILTLALYEVEDPTRAGIVAIDDGGRVRQFVEKPLHGEIPGRQASAGILVAEPSILGYVPPEAFFDIGKDLIPRLLQGGAPVFARTVDGYILDIGSRERYEQAQSDVADGKVRRYRTDDARAFAGRLVTVPAERSMLE